MSDRRISGQEDKRAGGSTVTDPRIVLAAWMGWSRGRIDTVAVMGKPIRAQRWIDPDGQDRAPTCLPNPQHNAADCESLIRKLNEEGWLTEVTFGTASGCDNVKLISIKDSTVTHRLLVVEWKAGVVELAMKVIADG